MAAGTAARYAVWSVVAALATMGLKLVAWQLTGSVGLLSDALESSVNLTAALVAFWALRLAAMPPDDNHAYGHGKAEYFAGGFEGAMIAVASLSILWAAVPRLWDPRPIEQAGAGLAVSAVAAALNFAMSRALLHGARVHRSLALEADAHHLMTDVWTSVAIIGGVALVALSGWTILDPLLAVIVALNILRTGGRLLRRSAEGLMDASLPQEDRDTLERVLQPFRAEGIGFHAIRTRQSGARRFISLHVLVPGPWTVSEGHDLAHRVERSIREELSPVHVATHVEPLEDPAAYEDDAL
jgi:cation diffusion facilitator family transporter